VIEFVIRRIEMRCDANARLRPVVHQNFASRQLLGRLFAVRHIQDYDPGTPFGFAFGLRNELFVSEAAGSASSYVLGANGTPALASGAVSTHQGAPCWAVVTQDGRFGFTGNGAGSVSAFTIAPDGSISLVDANGGTALIGAGINDIALSHNSRYLYVLQTGGAQAIHAFRVAADGHLTPLGPIAGLPNGTRGLAAF